MTPNLVLWQNVHKVAKELVGIPFRHDSDPPRTFNCLTLILFATRKLGWRLPYDEVDAEMGLSKLPQHWYTDPAAPDYYRVGFDKVADVVPLEDAYSGDIFLFNLESRKVCTHAGLSIDGCQFLHIREREGSEVSRLHGQFLERLACVYRVRDQYRS